MFKIKTDKNRYKLIDTSFIISRIISRTFTALSIIAIIYMMIDLAFIANRIW